MKEKMKKIYEVLAVNKAYEHAMVLLNWDLETEAPTMALEGISKTMGVLSELSYMNLVNDEFKDLLYSLDEEKLEEIDMKVVKKIKKDIYDKMSKIPVEEYSKYSELITNAVQKWQEAKNSDNYDIFKNDLLEIINTNKRFIKYRGYEGHPYNLLLNDYEDGLTIEKADEFFNKVRNELAPLIKEIYSKENKLNEIKAKFYSEKYDIEKQKKMSKEITEIMKFNYDSGVIKESEHPFTTNMNNKDIRITTHYYENDPLQAIYSTIHEAGHALYEQQVSDVYDKTNMLGGGTSMGIHESQSRFYENMLGRHPKFLEILYDLFEKYFNIKSKNVSFEEFSMLLNEVNNSLIRIEADELTYSLHILVRYELEKEIFSDLEKEIDIDELAIKWADKYEEYLGVRPKTFAEGILQDTHWAGGSFGYFPSYALGSAYSAQIYNALSKEIDIEKELSNKDFSKINEFLKDKIHQYGSSKNPNEIIINATGEEFNPNYYIDYLKNKFKKIYNID